MNSFIWILKMSWRDSRTHRKRLFLFMTSIILGVAALVAIGSFGENLQSAIDEQSKTLLGADFMIASLQPYDAEMEALIDSLGGNQAREILFGSMAFFPKSKGTRLVQVRAIEGDYPFYGEIGTLPKKAAATYKSGSDALVDESLMLSYDVTVGDSITIGKTTFRIAGRITKLPNAPPIASTFNPRVYLPHRYVDETELIQRGSLVNYRVYFKFEDGRDVEALVNAIEPRLNQNRIRFDTAENRKQNVADVMEDLYRFLNLVGFVALILGGIGVASAVHVYIKQKLLNISILRCVGATAKTPVAIYLIQVLTMALLGSLIGAALGLAVQLLLPDVFADFIPVEIEHFIAWGAIGEGVLVGLTLALLFASVPLLSVRKVSPLLAIRAEFENGTGLKKDKLRWLVLGLILIAISLFAIMQTNDPVTGLGFAAAILIAFAVLTAVAKSIIFLFRKFFPTSWPYVWRQGLANLYRPNNQTWVLMLAVGLGTFLITTLYLSHGLLLDKVAFAGGGDRPNLILFDIQPDQKDDLLALIESHDFPVMQVAPMIAMRIDSINGIPVETILSDSTRDVDEGLLRWQFRTTYRDTLFESEVILEGNWVGTMSGEPDLIPISFEEGAAERIGLSLGDTVVWDVQGVPLQTRVGSLRKVDWQRVQANFFVVFPANVLEYAPQIFVVATKAPTTEASAALQRDVVQKFPNISLIDLALILKTVDGFLDKISFVIRFMAFFSILTGLVVLAAAVITSRFQRIQESVLLRTLGASRQQIRKIMLVEYLFLGTFAAVTGLLLSYAGSWALAFFVFDSIFVANLLPFVIMLLAVVALTLLIGMSNSRGILDRPPLESLRMEA